MKRKIENFVQKIPFILAVIVSVAIIWLESKANNGQGGCLSMMVLGGWVFAAFTT